MSLSDFSAEQLALCERLTMALSEAGYPDAVVRWNDHFDAPEIFELPLGTDSVSVAWKAFTVCGCSTPCLACYRYYWDHGEPYDKESGFLITDACVDHGALDCGVRR